MLLEVQAPDAAPDGPPLTANIAVMAEAHIRNPAIGQAVRLTMFSSPPLSRVFSVRTTI